MKVNATIFVLMGHLPQTVHKCSVHGVYEYDIYISVPSSPGKFKNKYIEPRDANPEMLYILLLWRTTNIGISFLFDMLPYVVY